MLNLGRLRGHHAVFDADGTLWREDLAEAFTEYLVAQGQIDPERWRSTQKDIARDDIEGCFSLYRIYDGIPVRVVRQQVETYWRDHPPTFVPTTVDWIEACDHAGLNCWLVSATLTDILAPIRKRFPFLEILGTELRVLDGFYQARLAKPASLYRGKVTRLHAMGVEAVAVAMGNSWLDIPMLAMGTEHVVCVAPDERLAARAQVEGWSVSS